MPRGPRKQPKRLKILKGTYKPGRDDGEDLYVPAGCAPPDWLDARALELWHELAPGLIGDGILTHRDQHTLAQACDGASKMEALTRLLTPEYVVEQAQAAHYPQAVSLLKHYTKQFNDAAARLGLNPADRQRLRVPKPKDAGNPWAQIHESGEKKK